MARIGFGVRLAYVRWLLSRGRIDPLSDTEYAAKLGVGKKWLGKWKTEQDSPKGRKEADAIKKALFLMAVTLEWLYDGDGEPPEPEKWQGWLEDYVTNASATQQAAEAEYEGPQELQGGTIADELAKQGKPLARKRRA